MNAVLSPLKLRMRGRRVADLQEALLTFLKRGILIPGDEEARQKLVEALGSEKGKQYYGRYTKNAVSIFQQAHNLQPTGEVDGSTARAMNNIIKKLGLLETPSEQPEAITIEGNILLEDGRHAKGLPLRFYRILFGGKKERVAQTKTDTQGKFRIILRRDGRAIVLEVRAVDPGNEEIVLSKPIKGLEKQEKVVINLVAPSSVSPTESEYRRLMEDLRPLVGNLKELAEAREDEKHHDLSFLSRSTGWDARLIALASLAERMRSTFKKELPAEGFYALFRAGLPQEKDQLVLLSPEIVERTLRKMRDAGIIGLNDEEITNFKRGFTPLAEKIRFEVQIPGFRSTYGEFLGIAGLDEEAKKKFLSLFLESAEDDEVLWQKAREAGLEEETIQRLRLQGKLALLTGNSASLVAHLMEAVKDPEELVEKDFDQTETWKDLLYQIAEGNEDRLQDLIPPAYTGERLENRLSAYAMDLARKIRQSYPTQVVARLVERDREADHFRFGNARGGLVSLLKRAARKGYEIGRTPVESFLKEHFDLLEGLNGDREVIKRHLKALHRVYQITPSDEAMPVLFRMGLTSAQEVTLYTEEEFSAHYASTYREIHDREPESLEASLIYRKARQVEGVVFNMASIIRWLGSAPPLPVISADREERESLREVIKELPTLETLFGSLDFCECEHCRSVLSPAAYLVDLLRTLEEWGDRWQRRLEREGRDPEGARKPYKVLIERRPDIIHIPLTCENTHTAMPYIDLVNEILEYWVAEGRLDRNSAKDTGSATSEELIAEPQYIEPEAYKKLQKARYPINLPFDLWIETVRKFCDLFEMPLWWILEVFRPTDALFEDSGEDYGLFAVLMEQLGLSPAEVSVFTDPNLLNKWYRLYGYQREEEATELNSAKILARRLGVSYRELAEILQTGFVNPELHRDDRILILDYEEQDVCDFEKTTVRHANGEPAKPIDFLRINIFVRLWRKLGLSIRELDCALRTFIPRNAPFDEEYLDRQPLKSALIYLAHFNTLAQKLNLDEEGQIRLLTLWSDIPRDWEDSLYARLFLTPTILQGDDIFDDPLGHYLEYFDTSAGEYRSFRWEPGREEDRETGYVALKNHLHAIQGALGLTAEEIGLILEDAGTSLDAAPLDIRHVSTLHRYAHLARSLDISVREIISLKELSGVNPFEPLVPGPLTRIEEDHPFTRTLRFVEIVEQVKKSGLTIEDLEYLFRHRFDPVGKYRPNRQEVLGFLIELADGVRAIRSEHAVPENAEGVTDEMLRQKLALLLSPEVVDRFLAMVKGEAEGSQAREFFVNHLKKEDATGFLEEGDFETLFTPLHDESANAQLKLQERYLRIAQAFFPYLQSKLIRRLVVEILSTRTEADISLVESLITDPDILSLEENESLLDTFLSSADRGVTAHFYATTDLTGEPYSLLLEDVDTDLRASDIPARSARFEGYMVVPASGAYRFYLVLEGTSEYELRFDHLAEPLLSSTSDSEGYTELRAGILYRFTLSLRNLTGRVRLELRGDSLPKGGLSRLFLYPVEGVDKSERAYTLLRKVLKLIEALGLTEREVLHILTHRGDFGGINLSEIPTRAEEATPERAKRLFGYFLRLAGYAALKADLAGGTDDPISVFEARQGEEAYERIAGIARRSPDTVKRTAQVLFGESPEFSNEQPLIRLWEALKIVERFGAPPEAFERWRRIVSKDGADDGFGIAQDVRKTIRARFGRGDWLRMVQPISDRLRQKKRDALTAYVMHHLGYERMEQLYEHFLIDPGMEPVVRTSRIRLAIASVQLFIQRCLLNLEKEVSPYAIDAQQWEWMKRYRVWEANRKIFLWPENWLEPEFRDDKTHLFQELESALLEGDVSEDLVEDAFLNYLNKLDELARLDIVAMHIEYRDRAEDNVLHVFGRTYSQPHKYFYRRYAHGQWTPWEPMNIQIQGDHLAPVVWHDRLYLFWVTFLEKPVMPEGKTARQQAEEPVTPPPKGIEAQLHWSYYDNGRWSAPEASGFMALDKLSKWGRITAPYVPHDYDVSKVFVFANVDNEGVSVYLIGKTSKEFGTVQLKRYFNLEYEPSDLDTTVAVGLSHRFYLRRRNNTPELRGISEISLLYGHPYLSLEREATRLVTTEESDLEVRFTPGVAGFETDFRREEILRNNRRYSLLLPNNAYIGEEDSLLRSFFYQDRLNTFFVEPEIQEKTIKDWKGWLERPPVVERNKPEWIDRIGELVRAAFPEREMVGIEPEEFRPPVPINPEALFTLRIKEDLVVNPRTAFAFEGTLIGAKGRIEGETGGLRVIDRGGGTHPPFSGQ